MFQHHSPPLQIPQTIINDILIQHSTQPSQTSVVSYISYIAHPICHKPPITTYNSTPSEHRRLPFLSPHHEPKKSHYLTAYTNAATIYPCPPQYITPPCYPIIYQLCEQLTRSISFTIRSNPTISMHYPTCNNNLHTSPVYIPCHLYVAFTLLT